MPKPLTPAEQYEMMQIDKDLRESPPETPADVKRRAAQEVRYAKLAARLKA